MQAGALQVPRLNSTQSKGLAAEFGLLGLNDKDFEGMTQAQARIKAQQIREQRAKETSALTSYTYNPQAISGFRDIFKDLKLKLDDNNNYSWDTKQTKKQKNEATLNSYTNQLAGMFSSPDEFLAAQQDPEMQRMLKQYEQMGGSRNTIAANIGVQPAEQQMQSSEDVGAQTLDQYLGNINTKQQQMAMEALIPEKQIAQDQISFLASIPEAYKQYYFGTPEQIGLLERKEMQAKETIKLLERRAQSEERSARASAQLASQKAEVEREQANAEIEKNRLTAKNYMMGQLAKLGALKTTGAAPSAIANLEQKYQEQAQRLNTQYEFAERELSIKLREAVDEIELGRDESILKIKQDLSKSEEDVWKEIFKLEIDAKKQAFTVVNTFAGKFRTQTESYRKELKSEAEKYAKELAKKASSYNTKYTFDEFIASKKMTPLNPENFVPEFLRVQAQRKKEEAAGVPREMQSQTADEEMSVDQKVSSELQSAAEAIAAGADRQAVKQRFLQEFPGKSSQFEAFVGN